MARLQIGCVDRAGKLPQNGTLSALTRIDIALGFTAGLAFLHGLREEEGEGPRSARAPS